MLQALADRSPIRIADAVRMEVEEVLRRAWPSEACGLLAGGKRDIVDQWRFETNTSDRPDKHFVLEPLALSRFERSLDEAGRYLLGVVHSHPDCPAIPSETDRRFARNWPGFLWWIVGVNQGSVASHRCWELDNQQRFRERPLLFVAAQVEKL